MITDNSNKKVPNYYKTMYLDGFTPNEIYSAFKKSLRSSAHLIQKEEPIEDYNMTFNTTIEVR